MVAGFTYCGTRGALWRAPAACRAGIRRGMAPPPQTLAVLRDGWNVRPECGVLLRIGAVQTAARPVSHAVCRHRTCTAAGAPAVATTHPGGGDGRGCRCAWRLRQL